ncbi:MAG: hypothetical protein HYT28_02235 [Parcubacteria group bacterium]|nr:hypothetical protein [Parcubacteria group bacterium]
MEKIYNIRYIDAYYIYDKNIDETRLVPHNAYGYMERNGNNIIIIFIKKRRTDNKKIVSEKRNIIEGLVIPDAAPLSIVNTHKTNILRNVIEGSFVAITLRDVVHVTNIPRYDCSIMYTEGILFKIKKDHVVLKDPQTIRIYPTPIVNHPGGGKPTYLIVPISFITDIEVISQNHEKTA